MQQQLFNAAQASKWAGSWIERNQLLESDLQERADDLLYDLDNASQVLKCAANNIANRPAIGVYGASQAGKSYLISKMAAGDSPTLNTHWDDFEVDFIRHANPQGQGSEATGFVTRFTHKASQAPKGYPVELKILNEIDIAMILVNSFFEDINQKDVVFTQDEKFYLNHLNSLERYVDRNAQLQQQAFPKAGLSELAQVNSSAQGKDPLEFALTKSALVSPGRQIRLGSVVEYNYVQPEQVTELALYVGRNSKGKIGSFSQMPTFWSKLRQMLPYMSLEGRVEALSVFWKGSKIYSQTYRHIASELLLLSGYSKIFATKEAFVVDLAKAKAEAAGEATAKAEATGAAGEAAAGEAAAGEAAAGAAGATGDAAEAAGGGECDDNEEQAPAAQLMQRAGGTIMHITLIKDMFSEKNEKVPCALVSAPFGFTGTYEIDKVVEVDIAILATISLELCYVLENSGPLDDFDVIDFPGARSRMEALWSDIENLEKDYQPGKPFNPVQEEKATEFIRRGKVAYLFDRYARQNEIEQLIFCVGVYKQPETAIATSTLTDWISANIGNDPKKRATGYNPLTVVLTQYDFAFARGIETKEGGLPFNLKGEVNIAFDHLSKCSWFTEWVPGKKFNRIFLARRPNLGKGACPWLDFDDNKQEIAFNHQYEPWINEIKEALISVEAFNDHINNYPQALEEVLRFNDGGVSAIIDAIKANALPQKQRASVRLNKSEQLLQKVLSNLGPYATRDSAVALQKAKQESRNLAYGLMQCNALSPCFDLLRSLLELPDNKLIDLYSQNFTTGSNVQRFVQFVCLEYEDNLAYLWRKDNANINNIADNIVRAYKRNLVAFEADESVKHYFPLCYNQAEGRFKTLEELKDDVITLFNKLYIEVGKAFNSSVVGLKNYMVQVLLDQENTSEGFRDSVKSLVQLLQLILSDFNLYLGTNLLPTEEDKKLIEQAKAAASQMSVPTSAPSAPAAPPKLSAGFAMDDDEFGDFGDFDDDNSYALAGAPVASPVTAATAKHNNAVVGSINPSEFAMQVAQKGGVIGSAEGPVNCFEFKDGYVLLDEGKQDHQVFYRSYQTDEAKMLPHLDESSKNYEFNLVSDYASTLMYVMTKVNVLTENKYQFSSEENLLLCRILSTLETVE